MIKLQFMILDREKLLKFVGQAYGSYQIALHSYAAFKKYPKEVAEELKEIFTSEILADVVGNLCIMLIGEVVANPSKFLDDHNKKVEQKQDMMLELFGDTLKEFNEKEIKANRPNKLNDTKSQ